MFQLTWRDTTAWSRQGVEHVPVPPPDPAVARAALLCWEEHCVECSMPQCYATCSLFVARPDQKCARFVYGIVPNSQVRGLFRFGADIRFRRWAKLQTAWPSHLALLGVRGIRAQAALLHWSENAVSTLAKLIQRWSPKRRLNGAFTAARRKLLESQSAFLPVRRTKPDVFFIKCYSRESSGFRIQLELVTDVPVFRTSLPIEPGWNEHFLDAAEMISLAADKAGVLRLSIENDREVRLIFTWLDFVTLSNGVQSIPHFRDAEIRATGARSRPAPAEKIKCVAWDLDNTLWHGVIGDAGPAGVTPNHGMIDLIPRLDEKGILQTIVSKNNYDTAWPRIEQLGLADYFLFPAIHWGPKSRSVQQIADELNINVDAFAVIDDSAFERHEISSALPQVRVYDPADRLAILNDAAFDVPLSDETRTRRLQYMTEAKRKRVQQASRGDYDEFLRQCHMIIRLRTPGEADSARCIELLQRSNQFNLSGRRYSLADYADLVQSENNECFCFEVTDDFGNYGIVGFAVFEKRHDGSLLTEFVMSCRVAQKRVEETFLKWYAAEKRKSGFPRLLAQLRVTAKNVPLRDVLDALGFRCIEENNDDRLLEIPAGTSVEVPDVIRLIDERSSSAPEMTGHRAGLSQDRQAA